MSVPLVLVLTALVIAAVFVLGIGVWPNLSLELAMAAGLKPGGG